MAKRKLRRRAVPIINDLDRSVDFWEAAPVNLADATESELFTAVRRKLSHGHPLYADLALGELKLHNDKNYDYARGGSALGNFERVAKIMELYPGLNLADPKIIALMYLMKQFDGILWAFAQGSANRVESVVDKCRDISVYMKIIQCLIADEAQDALLKAKKA